MKTKKQYVSRSAEDLVARCAGFPFSPEELGYETATEVYYPAVAVSAPPAEAETASRVEDPPCKVVHETEPCEDKTIIDKVAGFIERFLFLKDKSQYTLIAAWIVATHLHQNFEYLGYLFAYSPERQSGKTTLLELLDLLVRKSTGLQISPTEAVLFRTAEDRTHLLDEVDSWKNRDELKDVLNAGYKRGGKVTRCDKSKAGFTPREFPVFAPRALAGIGLSILPSTTLDRTFALPMVRQKKNEKRERFRERKLGVEAKELKGLVEKWAKQNAPAVAECYDKADFPYLENFSDRTIDIAEPLAAVM